MGWKFPKIFYTSRIFVKAVRSAEVVPSAMGALIAENAIRSNFIQATPHNLCAGLMPLTLKLSALFRVAQVLHGCCKKRCKKMKIKKIHLDLLKS